VATAKSGRVEEFHRQLVAALEAELTVARRFSSGERTLLVEHGKRVERRGKTFVYEFVDVTGVPPEEGTQVTFSVGERISAGRFLGEIEGRTLFELDKDLGASIADAKVTSDPLFLLEKQLERLRPQEAVSSMVALATVGLGNAPAPTPIPVTKKALTGLNSLQQTAVEAVAGQATTYIWGPPGTGKTTAVAATVAALAANGQRVLLVSNTNLAIDTALERCLDRLAKLGTLSGGDALRLGPAVKPELKTKYQHLIDLESLAEAETAPLQQELMKMSKRLQGIQNKHDDAVAETRIFAEQTQLASAPSSVASAIAEKQAAKEQAIATIDQLETQLRHLDAELNEARTKSALGRMFSSKRNPNTIQRDIAQAGLTKERHEAAVLSALSEIARLQQQETEQKKSSTEAKGWLQAHPQASTASRRANDLKEEVQSLKAALEAISDEIASKYSDILQRAKVIACTAYRPLLDRDVAQMQFDCVIVDEASMLTLPLYFCNAILAKSRVVIAGDFRQLPPIVRLSANSELDSDTGENSASDLRNFLTTNPFIKSGIITRSLTGKPTPELVALRDQYRMRDEIADLISNTFYPEHTLRTVLPAKALPTPWGDAPFTIFDTSTLAPESVTVNGKSRRNIVHALAIKAIAEALHADGWSTDATSEKSFGVISPYAKQAALIAELISGTNPSHSSAASTVHRFQGNERDLMIIDTTKVASPNDPSLGTFMGSTNALAPENAMWNVAFSRARHHILLIADLPTLKSNPNAVISRLTEYAMQHGNIVSAATIIGDALTDASGPGRRKRGSLAWYTEDQFYREFSDDLSACTQSAFIASPFATKDGSHRWAEVLSRLSLMNISTTCLTKPIAEKDSRTSPAEVQSILRSMFTEVREIPRMHEKIAVIDEHIVWMGSLNIRGASRQSAREMSSVPHLGMPAKRV